MPEEKRKSGYFLRLEDFKKIEEIIEYYNCNEKGVIDTVDMANDEKDILWKVKTIIHNIESSRLRVRLSPERASVKPCETNNPSE
jgi:hypothetical protein